MDLIDRQAAIDALSTPHGILHPIRTVEELPSVQSDVDARFTEKEQAYMSGWEDGQKALRKGEEMVEAYKRGWTDGRRKLAEDVNSRVLRSET